MEVFDINRFAEYKENNFIEAKKAAGGIPNSIWETYSSFANTKGGIILLGVVENEDKSFKATGVNEPEKMRKELWDILHNENKVSVNILNDGDIDIRTLDGKAIITMTVRQAERSEKPVYIGKDMFTGTYRRDFEGDYRCSRGEVRAMLRDQSELSVDEKILDNPVEELNRESIHAYMNVQRAKNPDHPFLRLPLNEYLRSLGAAAISRDDGKFYTTAAGLLMFGNEYDIVREFPEYFLDYRECLDPNIRWTDRYYSSSGRWSGNVFDFYYGTYNKLAVGLKTPFKMEGMYRVDDTPIHRAVREALVNTLANADYYDRQGVVIIRNRDEITFANPGSIRIGKNQMLIGGVSDPRNKTLLKMFNLIDIGERSGSGVPNIFNTWKDAGYEEPEIIEKFEPARTVLRLPILTKAISKNNRQKQSANHENPANMRNGSEDKTPKNNRQKQSAKTIENNKKIVKLLMDGEKMQVAEIAEYIGLSVPRTRVILRNMLEAQVIKAQGNSRSRVYYI